MGSYDLLLMAFTYPVAMHTSLEHVFLQVSTLGVFISGNYAYVADDEIGLIILQIREEVSKLGDIDGNNKIDFNDLISVLNLILTQKLQSCWRH